MSQLLGAISARIVFVDVTPWASAIQTLRSLRAAFPNLPIAAVHRLLDPGQTSEVASLNVTPVALPFTQAECDALLQSIRQSDAHPPNQYGARSRVYSFLPAKQSAGATTLAVNAALRLSLSGNERPLLIDLDLNCGLVAFMLGLSPDRGIYDAAQQPASLDDAVWSRLIARKDGLDVIASPCVHVGRRIEPSQFIELLNFARRLYDVICLDLSGNLEKFSVEVMRESHRVFVVCTPELASVYMARKKIKLLRDLGLGAKLNVLLNRSDKKSALQSANVEDTLKEPVFLEFSNDYAAVQSSIVEGAAVKATSSFGEQIRGLAEAMRLPATESESSGVSAFSTEILRLQRAVAMRSPGPKPPEQPAEPRQAAASGKRSPAIPETDTPTRHGSG